MSRTIRAGLAVAALALTATQAQASPLTAANFSLLCTPDGTGRLLVDPDRLALALVDMAGATLLLDGANDAGLTDGQMQLVSTPSRPAEPVYLVLNAEAPPRPDDPRPFWRANAAAAREALVTQLSALDVNSLLDSGVAAGPGRRFRALIRPGMASRHRPGGIDPRLLFGPDAVYEIECSAATLAEAPRPGGGANGNDDDSDPDRGVGVDPVLRGSVQALWIERDDNGFAESKPANIGYDRDDVADTDTFRLNAVAGLRFVDRSGTFAAIPYLSYERASVTGPNDIEKLSPGLLLTHALERRGFSLHSRLETSFIDDMEQGSQQGKLRIYIDPAISLGRTGFLFGSRLNLIPGVFIRPELTLIADASHVFRAGTSTALANAENYFGAGGDLSLTVGPENGPLNFIRLTVGGRDLAMFGDIQQDHIRRWYGSLMLSDPNFPYAGLALTFNDGENDDTFQVEERYSLSLIFRY